VTASIVTILDLACKLMQYANSIRKASQERVQVAREASAIYSLLTQLGSRVDQCQTNEPWFNEAKLLATKGGVLDQLKSILENLVAKIDPGSRMKDFVWKITSKEVDQALAQIERLKSRISIALQQDHLWVHFPMSFLLWTNTPEQTLAGDT
jgi:hypothetical protein